jgi:hypothetical protein
MGRGNGFRLSLVLAVVASLAFLLFLASGRWATSRSS